MIIKFKYINWTWPHHITNPLALLTHVHIYIYSPFKPQLSVVRGSRRILLKRFSEFHSWDEVCVNSYGSPVLIVWVYIVYIYIRVCSRMPRELGPLRTPLHWWIRKTKNENKATEIGIVSSVYISSWVVPKQRESLLSPRAARACHLAKPGLLNF